MNRSKRRIFSSARVSNPMIIKVSICAISVLALVYIVLFQGGHDAVEAKGARAAEGIQKTSQQAEDMSHTASRVSNLIEGAAVHQAHSLASGVDISTDPNTDGAPDTADAWYVQRLEELVERWGPDYAAARADIDRFEHRFRTSRDRLREYFDEQAGLTEDVNDPELRAELHRRDEEERAAYQRWTTEGRNLLNRALAMRSELDDMDIVIRKQQLTVSMLSQYTRESSIPRSAENLYRSLGEFRMQSDALAMDLSTRVFN